MSDRQIQVGDMVVVVRWPCCNARLGMVDKVTSIDNSYLLGGTCYGCGGFHQYTGLIATTAEGHIWPVAWLKRIPPLSELEGQRTQEDMKEPA